MYSIPTTAGIGYLPMFTPLGAFNIPATASAGYPQMVSAPPTMFNSSTTTLGYPPMSAPVLGPHQFPNWVPVTMGGPYMPVDSSYSGFRPFGPAMHLTQHEFQNMQNHSLPQPNVAGNTVAPIGVSNGGTGLIDAAVSEAEKRTESWVSLDYFWRMDFAGVNSTASHSSDPTPDISQLLRNAQAQQARLADSQRPGHEMQRGIYGGFIRILCLGACR